MLHIKDIPRDQINTVMSYKNWTKPSDQMTFSRLEDGNVHLVVKSMLGNTCKIDDDQWSHSQMCVDTGALSGVVLHVNKSFAFDKSKEPTFVITLASSIADLSKMVNGDKVHFEWDLSKLPKSHFTNNPYIVRAGLSAKQCGYTDIPDLGNIFVQCVMDNQEIPSSCEFHDGDRVPTSNKHFKEANNRLLYEVKKSDNYNIVEPVVCLQQKEADAVDIVTSLALIPETKMSRNILAVAEEEKAKATLNNTEFYYVQGQQILNKAYVAEGVK